MVLLFLKYSKDMLKHLGENLICKKNFLILNVLKFWYLGEIAWRILQIAIGISVNTNIKLKLLLV